MILPRNPYQKINIREVDEVMGGGSEDPRTAHTGLFQECSGTLPTNKYLDGDITISILQENLLKYYEFDAIAYASWQEFARRFTNLWNLEFPIFRQNLENIEDFTVIDSLEEYKEQLEGTNSASGSNSADMRYTDTPGQYLTQGNATENGLTSYQKTAGQGEQSGQFTTTRNTTRDRGGNKFERWLQLSEQNRNIVTDFYNKFRNLFSTTHIYF